MINRKGFLFTTFVAPLLALFSRGASAGNHDYLEMRWNHNDAEDLNNLVENPFMHRWEAEPLHDPGVALSPANQLWDEANAQLLDPRIEEVWDLCVDRPRRGYETDCRFVGGPFHGRIGHGQACPSRDNWQSFRHGDWTVHYRQDLSGDYMFDPDPPVSVSRLT